MSLTFRSLQSFLKQLLLQLLVYSMKRSGPLGQLVDRLLNKNDPTKKIGMDKKTVHVEVCQATTSKWQSDKIMKLVYNELMRILHIKEKLPLNKILTLDNYLDFQNTDIATHVKSVYLSTGDENESTLTGMFTMIFHVYQLNEEEAAADVMQKDGEEISASTNWILPNAEFHELWVNLFYNDNIKEQLLRYVETAMMYSEKQVNPHVISWNKVILLHGPPGTGKTSLCKALAQKITIRLNHKFPTAQLVEINSHSLFSKWFSESGKLVMNLFNEIKLLLQDESTLVFILIDEVESLAHARKSSANGSEPSDSVRVVNALLTQLDNLKRHPNVLILTTSNLTEAIDLAFVDRADIKQFIPHPNETAIYKIYSSCIKELMRTGLLRKEKIFDMEMIKYHTERVGPPYHRPSYDLLQVSLESKDLSGRILRKIPFLAHTRIASKVPCTAHEFLEAMRAAVQNERASRVETSKLHNT